MSNSTKIILGRVQLLCKGEYDSLKKYNLLDVVTYQGSSYVCKKENTIGILPTNEDVWQISAEKGDTGNGIEKIEKTLTDGNRDIYTIFFTNGNKSEFIVENGTMTFIEKTYFNASGELIIVTNNEVDISVNESGELIIQY